MNLSILLAAFLAVQSPAAPASGPAWTWALYEGQGPLVLAEEVPDTPRLRTTLECEPRSGRVALTFYDATTTGGFATARSGDAATTAQVMPSRGHKMDVALRTDLPVFAAFVVSGEMTVTLGEDERRVTVPRPHLAKLRRFTERCMA